MTERGRRALFWSTLISLLVFQTHSAFAQSQAVTWATARQQALSEARDLLRSGEASDVAWGAFRAAEYRLTDLLPDVVARLEASPESSGDESYALRSALVDSAVQLSAAVPAPVLRTYWKDFPVQSAILFAKTTGPRDDVLLDLLSSSTDLRWFALANLLVQSRPDGFIQKVLAPLHLQLDVTVSEEGRAGSGGSGGGGVGDGVGQSPPGFPPRATYRFESASWPGHVVLSTGPRLVYYSRSVSYAFQFGVSEAFIGGPTGAERLTYAHACAFPAEAGIPSYNVRRLGERHESAPWEGEDALRRRVQDLRTDMLQAYRAFLARLVTAQRLTAEDVESHAQPPVDVSIIDARTDKSAPLPVIK